MSANDDTHDKPGAETDAALQTLRALLGDAQVLTGADAAGHETDWRRRYQGRALAVVRPGSTDEVAAVLRWCAAQQPPVAVVPQGGNTGLVGGGVPDGSGRQLVLSLARMNRVRGLDAANLSLTLEAGVVLQAAQSVADDAGLLFPLSLAAEGSCTVGGNLASNAGGTQVLRFGNARELCLGLEVVTASGAVWSSLSGLRKDNTGYDLRDLFIGSEGTLGVITAATFKLFPAPRSVVTGWAHVASLDQAVALLGRLRAGFDAELTAFETMGLPALRLTHRHFPDLAWPLPPGDDRGWAVLFELSSPHPEDFIAARAEAVLGEALEAGEVDDLVIAQNRGQAAQLWRWRESIPTAQAHEGLNIKHDIGVPVSAIPAFVAAADAALAALRPGLRHVAFGHLGDGNLHYNLQAPEGESGPAFLREFEARANACVHDLVQAHGGTISAEHGIGQLKRDELVARKPATHLALMQAIKAALDPMGLLNPGKMLSAPGA